jgi:hypothetical protein
VDTATDELLTERLLRVIDEGRRTATNKLALLLAMMDIVAAEPGVEKIPTRRTAPEVLARYLTQTRACTNGDAVPGRDR